MAHLKIATPEGMKTDGFIAGYMASIWLDGEDISRYVTKCSVETDSEGAIFATLVLALGGLNVDLPVVIKELILKEAKSVVRD